MGVRAAGSEDYEDLVTRLLATPMPPLLTWALEPAPDLVAARVAYYRWLSAALLRIGKVWLGDDGSIAGGRRIRIRLMDRLRAPNPDHGELSVTRGPFSWPDVPSACQRRMLALAEDGLKLRSSGHKTFLVQLWSGPLESDDAEALDELVEYCRLVRHNGLVVTSGPAGTERLRRAGFVQGADSPAGPEGRPGLTAWELRLTPLRTTLPPPGPV